MSKLLVQYNNNLNLKYYLSLKKILHKHHNNKYDSHLENILSDDLLTESESVTQQSVTQQSVTESVILSDIKINEDSLDDYYYKKAWTKLNIIHKKIKIKEYIHNLMLTKQKKKILLNKLINLLNEKKLNKKNDINYDSNNGKIITITILKCKNDEYFI